jgi:glycerol-3-phosphate acyltransferase PlsY
LITLSLVIGSYLLGSIATAVVSCRLLGLPDPRAVGSGNPGATNVLRTAGKKAAIITLAGDMLKGLLPMLLAHALGLDERGLALVGLAAFVGHLYPIYFGFKGGKGVATGLGVLLGLDWVLGLCTIATWLAMALVFRISSLAALTAFLLAPVYATVLIGVGWASASMLVISALLFWRHRSNIRNILDGTEGRIGTP